jgi:hypothetical protein
MKKGSTKKNNQQIVEYCLRVPTISRSVKTKSRLSKHSSAQQTSWLGLDLILDTLPNIFIEEKDACFSIKLRYGLCIFKPSLTFAWLEQVSDLSTDQLIHDRIMKIEFIISFICSC